MTFFASNLKRRISEKLDKIQILLNTPGAYGARLAGCSLDLSRMVYRLYAMELSPKTILDIGAYRGMFSKCAHYVFPEAMIYAFEPLKDCFEELIRLKKTINKFECYNVALGEKKRETFIHRSSFDAASSLLEMDELHKQAFPDSPRERLEKIKVESLDAVLIGKPLEVPLLMKIDVQGYEKLVLNGAPETLKHTDYIICEMSLSQLYKEQALFDEIYHQIIKAGFKFSGPIGELQHPQTTEVLQIDGLFIRVK